MQHRETLSQKASKMKQKDIAINYQKVATHRIITSFPQEGPVMQEPLGLTVSHFLLGPPGVTASQIFMIIFYLHILNYDIIRHL